MNLLSRFFCQFLCHVIYFCLKANLMASLFKSVLKTLPVSASNQISPSSMSVTVHPSKELSEMSNLSTTSVVTALKVLQKSLVMGLQEFQNSIGMEMTNICDNMQKLVEICFRESATETGC